MSLALWQQSLQRPLRGVHVLAMIAAFFAVVFLVNGAMIYTALSTNTGVVGNEPYRKGLHYNERIAADVRQARLGWTETLSVGRDGRVAFTLASPDGRPVAGLRVAGVLGRPATDRHDIALALGEAAPGRYETRTPPLAAGSWMIALDARNGGSEDPIYRTRKRLWLAH
jgi:nitrogen fixation protein FixH